MLIDTTSIQEHLKSVQENIQKYNSKAEIICVTKKFPVQIYEVLIDLGVTQLAENYIQEAIEKREMLLPALQNQVRWHFIGQIQSNKIKLICQYFDVVHSLDKLKHAQKINEVLRSMNKALDVMVHVNLAGEDSKSGIELGDLKNFLLKLQAFEHIRCIGLMTFPPYAENPEENRKYFRQLSELMKNHLTDVKNPQAFKHLSMGVSHDYKVALQEGATMIRLGSLILGQRSAR